MEFSSKPLLTREEFIAYFKFIRERSDAQMGFCAALDALSPQTYNDAFVYSDYESKLVETIGLLVGDKNDKIGLYLYDMGVMSRDTMEDYLAGIEELWNDLMGVGGKEDAK